MFVRPLAFKGPNDHLTRTFSEEVLYSGFKLLSNNKLADLQQSIDQQWVEGYFFRTDEPQIRTTSPTIHSKITWPLSKDGYQCNCGETLPCAHVAALAIEAKVIKDPLIYPLKDNPENLPLWPQVNRWLRAQSHDPYPNMARHRLVYLIKTNPAVPENYWISVHKAYLTKDNKYVLKEKFSLLDINLQKAPKFVVLIDQEIIYLVNQQFRQSIDQDDPSIIKLNQVDSDLILKLQQTERLFWKASSRSPMELECQPSYSSDSQLPSSKCVNEGIDKGVYKPFVDNVFLDLPNNRLVINKPSHKRIIDGAEVFASLEVVSHRKVFPWQLQRPIDFDVGLVTFKISNFTGDSSSSITTDQLINDEVALSDTAKNKLARQLRLIQAIPTIKQGYPPPVARDYDSADRDCEMPFSQLIVWCRGLQRNGWDVFFANSYRLNKLTADKWFIDIADNDDWFNLKLGVTINGESFNLLPYIVSAISAGDIDLTKLDEVENVTIKTEQDVAIEVNSERLKTYLVVLNELFYKKPLSDNNSLQLSKQSLAQLSYLDQTDQAVDWFGDIKLKNQANALTNAKVTSSKLPQELNAKLRSYQKDGYDWLLFLRKYNINGILADDMGLGKTLQTLSLLLAIKQQDYDLFSVKKPNLIIAPTSLIDNWLKEIKKFTPTLMTLAYYGSQRKLDLNKIELADIVITSYGTLLRDVTELSQFDFDTIILDEAQAIKNSSTQMAKACFRLRSDHKLCLSGTPIENHLGELWSLFNFLMPGLLGTKAQFDKFYRVPIEQERDHTIQKALNNKIKPFVLRRTKDLVAKELPNKSEINVSLTLDKSQADFYEAVRQSMSEEVQRALANSANRNTLAISNALLRLRQICCDPRLVSWQKQTNGHSVKLDWLRHNLPELIEEGRKILIFSSFTSMLDIIEQELNTMSFASLKLTGKSKNRGELVDDFQQGDYPIFLISLKAGGAGLNLTAADTVIHFDPWWNPAAEDQASDRAHRIGQDKPVFIYKLITKGTVEEKIQKLQANKKRLANTLYDDLSQSFSDLKDVDWLELFSSIE
ncbi:MAG: DEAD/DEAH box helicase [Kangiellaceae bacterium]|jgi:non-specific serine/threonine protein kinase|nr:DEAD/DEAH box helicase [Kangiellaceae bacterium]